MKQVWKMVQNGTGLETELNRSGKYFQNESGLKIFSE
jgi:hypothetical protein